MNSTLTPALRRQALAVAAARQAIAHEAASYLPTWEELGDAKRAQAVTEAAWWLQAIRRAGLASHTVVVERMPDLDQPPEPIPPQAVPCTHCGTPVRWLTTTTLDRAVPIDAAPSKTGNILITDDTFGVLLPSNAAAAHAQGQPLHTRHRWTCPYAHRWATGGMR